MTWKYPKLAWAVLLLFAFSCNGSSRYFIKKEFPDKLYSAVTSGKVLFGTTSIRRINNQTRIVYRLWRFVEASRTHVLIVYEEHYENKKETPDLTEEIKAPIENDTVTFDKYRIRIYELKEDYIAFYLDRER